MYIFPVWVFLIIVVYVLRNTFLMVSGIIAVNKKCPLLWENHAYCLNRYIAFSLSVSKSFLLLQELYKCEIIKAFTLTLFILIVVQQIENTGPLLTFSIYIYLLDTFPNNSNNKNQGCSSYKWNLTLHLKPQKQDL